MNVQGIWASIVAAIAAFFTDPRVVTIYMLIVLDVLLGIAAAIRQKKFDFRRVGEFYLTMVIPYIIGYLAFYAFSKVAIPELLGNIGYLASEVMVTIAWLALVGCIGASAIANGKALGYKIDLPGDDAG